MTTRAIINKPVGIVTTKKGKQIQLMMEEIEYYFPDGVWNLIKQFMPAFQSWEYKLSKRKIIGRENKELFIRELASMLTKGELTYIEFNNIMKNSINFDWEMFIRNNYKERLMSYRNR
jgi:hypothetical protein